MVRRALLCVLIFAAAGTSTAWGLATAHENNARVTILDKASASPYPSQITVSGLSGRISDIDVDLRGLSHSCPADVDILLEGPNGEHSLLLSDTGGHCGPDWSNSFVTLDQEAPTPYPCESSPDGAFKPADATEPACAPNTEMFFAPAPTGPYAADLSVFYGDQPNGTWHLFVLDDTMSDAGEIARGFRLVIETTDGDGDGVPNARDRCDLQPAATTNGCPNVNRRLELRWRPARDLFAVRLEFTGVGNPACYRRRRVNLFYARRGPDRPVRSRLTNRQGRVRMRWANPWPGRYYAVAPRVFAFGVGNCLRVRSAPARVLPRQTDGVRPS